jgi:hypothetical protein
VDEDDSHRLVASYEAWWKTREPPAPGFLVEMADRLESFPAAALGDESSVRRSVAVLGFLWLIRDFEYVGRYGAGLARALALRAGAPLSGQENRRADAGHRPGPIADLAAAVENMVIVAGVRHEVKAYGAVTREVRDDGALVGVAVNACERLEAHGWRFPTNAAATALCQGYVLFRVWQRLNPAAMAAHPGRPAHRRYQELAERSLAIGLVALDECDPDAPEYALLINHCLYVAASTGAGGTNLERQGELALRLVVYRRNAQPWSYRFDDTLGYFYYARAARSLAELGDARDADRVLGSVSEDLAESKRWIARIGDDPADDVVTAHRGLIRELELEVIRAAR